MTNRRMNHLILAGLFATVTCAGCASLKNVAETAFDPDFTREQRKHQMVESFESRRDTAQFQGAIAKWENGDAQGCERMLLQLLRRSPNHSEARLWLADLYAEQNNAIAAEQQLRWLLRENPQDARAHHSLGLLLESSGNAQDALSHLQKAQQLDPSEPLYAQSMQAVRLAQRQE